MKNKQIIDTLSLQDKAVLCSGIDFWRTPNIAGSGIGSMFMSDGPHGLRKQGKQGDHLGIGNSVKATCYPTASTLANSFDTELLYNVGKSMGVEARAQGVDIVLGPGVNIKRNPLGGRNFEYFSEDPYVAGTLASSYINGMQSQGVASCIKHFALNSQETKRMVSNSIADKRTMHELYLRAFEIAIRDSKPQTLMSAYNKVNDEYADENTYLLKNVLRDMWNFDGVVISDWGGCNDIASSIRATSNIQMPSSGGVYTRRILDAVQSGELSVDELDECVDRIIELVKQMDKYNNTDDSTQANAYSNQASNNKNNNNDKPNDTVNDTAQECANQGFDIEAHHNFATYAASQSVVLLKNNNNALPIRQGVKVAIVGDFAFAPRYQGAGSSLVEVTKLDNVVECIKDYDVDVVGTAKGYHRYGKRSKRLVEQATKLAQKADVVLCFLGLDEFSEVEGIDRTHLDISDNQLELLASIKATGKRVIVVLSCGCVVDTAWDKDIDGLVYTGLGGQGSARGLLDVLVGKVNPSGRLSETFAHKYSDYPNVKYYPSLLCNALYKESIFVGYRYFATRNIDVKYEFGFGLSYSEFEYSDLQLRSDNGHIVATVDIYNSSDVAGSEIVQLYVSHPTDRVFNSKIMLKSFAKTLVQPKQRVSVEFVLKDIDAFGYFDVNSNAWQIVGGTYTISVGASSNKLYLSTDIVLASTVDTTPYDVDKLKLYYSASVKDIPDNVFEQLLGRTIPSEGFVFCDKRHIVVQSNTTVSMLRYSKGFAGRFIARVVRLYIGWCKLRGKRDMANYAQMGVQNLPLRNLAVFTSLNEKQLQGVIDMFNGKFLSGYRTYKKYKNYKKEAIDEIKYN